MNRSVLALAAMTALAACAAPEPQRRPIKGPPVPQPLAAGLARVMGKDARTLTTLFGDPDLDVREQGARKLQFASAACVLDAYLYARAAGGEPVVTHVDARQPNGDDMDPASCIAALSRRREAR